MEWNIDHGHATINEEAGSGQFQVKAKVQAGYQRGEDYVVFTATPDEKYSSLKARVANHWGLKASHFGLRFNGRYPTTNGYSHNEKLWFQSLEIIK